MPFLPVKEEDVLIYLQLMLDKTFLPYAFLMENGLLMMVLKLPFFRCS